MKLRTIWMLVFLLIAIGNQATAKETPRCPSTPYSLKTPEGYDHLRYAPGQRERLYDGGSFVASVDSKDDDNGDGKSDYLVQSTWVASHIKAYISSRTSKYAPSFKRPRDWYKIALFNEERQHFKTNKRIDNSYDGIGKIWNRGHLAQRADANRLGAEYGCNSHVFANGVPQKSTFNQGIWLGLENYISSLANDKGELWVVTGPIYERNTKIETIGEAGKKEIPVSIPDKLFKIVFMEQSNGVEVISFIYPNKYDELPSYYKTGNCQRDSVYDHTAYIVSIADIENQTGLTFFPNSAIDLTEYKNLRAVNLPEINPINAVGYCL